MKIHCNAGIASTSLVWNLPGYAEVWFHPEVIANIWSLSRVKEKYRVTFISKKWNKFVVHKTGGSTRIFSKSNRDFITMHWGMIGKQMFKLKKLKKILLSTQSKKTKANIQNVMCPEQL